MFALFVVPDIQQNYAIEIGSFSVLNFRISFHLSQSCRFAIIELLDWFFCLPIFTCILCWLTLLWVRNVQMEVPDFFRFPAKLRKWMVCIKCWKRFLTCWQSSSLWPHFSIFILTLKLNPALSRRYHRADMANNFSCVPIGDDRNVR